MNVSGFGEPTEDSVRNILSVTRGHFRTGKSLSAKGFGSRTKFKGKPSDEQGGRILPGAANGDETDLRLEGD